jgi:hypothetical protein
MFEADAQTASPRLQLESRRFQTLSNASRARHARARNSILNMK